jgi:DNA-binding Lrp family transcriptional regulator
MARMVEILGQKYSVDILRAADEPRSVSWLSQELEIPASTCYRRVNELCENTYLEEVTADGSNDKTRYRRTTDSIEIDLASDLLIRLSQSRERKGIVTLDSGEPDGFSRAVDFVESYFGDLINTVAVRAPVSRRQLVRILARAQLSGRQLTSDGLTGDGDIVYQSNDETLFWLDGDFWNDLRGLHQLDPDGGRAAREVHRRFIESINGSTTDCNRERDPFVLIN